MNFNLLTLTSVPVPKIREYVPDKCVAWKKSEDAFDKKNECTLPEMLKCKHNLITQ